jgi:hypothetical protein
VNQFTFEAAHRVLPGVIEDPVPDRRLARVVPSLPPHSRLAAAFQAQEVIPMKSQRKDRCRLEAPLIIDQELAIGDQLGEPNWFDLNRLRHPMKDRPRPAGSVGLESRLLEEDRVDSIDDWTPENADAPIGGPRSLGRPRPRMLRRFNGSLVEPAVFTQIYNGESRQVYSSTSSPWVRIGQLTPALVAVAVRPWSASRRC